MVRMCHIHSQSTGTHHEFGSCWFAKFGGKPSNPAPCGGHDHGGMVDGGMVDGGTAGKEVVGATGEDVAGEPGEEDGGAIGVGADGDEFAGDREGADGAGTELFLSPSRRPFPPLPDARCRGREASSSDGSSMAGGSRKP